MVEEADEDCFTSKNVTGVLSTPRFKAGIIHKYIHVEFGRVLNLTPLTCK